MTETHGLSVTFLTNYNDYIFPPDPTEQQGFGGYISTPPPMTDAGGQGFFLSFD